MFKIQLFNQIAEEGLKQFADQHYEVGRDFDDPDAILLRSQSLHDFSFSPSLKAIARAGAGVNNIPVEQLTKAGIPVFNSPGANANAVKELVLAGMLMTCRHLCVAWETTKQLQGDAKTVAKEVETIKKRFAGIELPGRTLGVIGLGAIGVLVANAAVAMGMNVIGYDPAITIERAWQLSAQVQQATSVNQLLQQSEFVTVHVPYSDATHHLIDEAALSQMPNHSVLLNFARGDIADSHAVMRALDNEQLRYLVTDFPTPELLAHDKVICLPHLGASTAEAEENCARMAAATLKRFLQFGEIQYSVNFPMVEMPSAGGYRISIANANVPNMVGQMSSCLAEQNINIIDMINKSRGDVAYTLIDINQPLDQATFDKIRNIDGILNIRQLDIRR